MKRWIVGLLLTMSALAAQDIGEKTGLRMGFYTPVKTSDGLLFDSQISIGKAIWTHPPVAINPFNQKPGVEHLWTANSSLGTAPFLRPKFAFHWGEKRHLIIVGQKPGGQFEKVGFRTTQTIQAVVQRVKTVHVVEEKE